jgi:hypothetical protein
LFDVTPEGEKRMYARTFEPGCMQTAVLRMPKKRYLSAVSTAGAGLANRLKVLIDVGVDVDTEGWNPGVSPSQNIAANKPFTVTHLRIGTLHKDRVPSICRQGNC